MMDATPKIKIEIAYAQAKRQWLQPMLIEADATVRDAITACDIIENIDGFDIEAALTGIWGNEVSLNQALRDGDRVEIYRKLELEPREARRRLALSGKTMKSS